MRKWFETFTWRGHGLFELGLQNSKPRGLCVQNCSGQPAPPRSWQVGLWKFSEKYKNVMLDWTVRCLRSLRPSPVSCPADVLGQKARVASTWSSLIGRGREGPAATGAPPSDLDDVPNGQPNGAGPAGLFMNVTWDSSTFSFSATRPAHAYYFPFPKSKKIIDDCYYPL